MCSFNFSYGRRIIIGLMVLASVSQAQAVSVFTETDLVAGSGDGYLFVDHGTNREWIDVTKTTGLSVNDLFSSSSFAGQGFSLAAEADVIELFGNAGASNISVSPAGFAITTGNDNAYNLLAGLMEHTSPYTQTGGDFQVRGYYDYGSSTNLQLAQMLSLGQGSGSVFAINYEGNLWDFDSEDNRVGTYAFRDANVIPLPAASVAGVLGFGVLGLMRRKRRN